jgi:hypothetical protein
MTAAADVRSYRYDTFTLPLMLADLRFGRTGLEPGDPVPVRHALDADGTPVALTGTGRPLLLISGSLTCPMTASAVPQILRLYDDVADRLDVVMLSVREAHPGENRPQPRTEAQIQHQGRALRDHYGIPFPVVVDDLDGRLHHLLDDKPNAALLFDREGILVFRSLWSSDARSLRTATDAVLADARPPVPQRTAMVGPMLRALGFIDQVVGRAGPSARRDLWRSALPMALSGRLAAMIPIVSPHRRGPLLAGIMAATAVAVVAVVGSAVLRQT